MNKNALNNASNNIKEMKEKKAVLSSLPFKLFVELTQRCNLQCFMCWDERRKIKEDISINLLEKIEEELFPYMAEVDFFLVGEPLLAHIFPKIFDRVQRYTFVPKIFTNATIYREDIYRGMIESGFFVNISIDAASEEMFERIRIGSKFEMFKRNIVKILGLADEIKNDRFHIRFCSTIGSYNLDEVLKILNLAKKVGVRDVMLNDCDMGPPHSNNLKNSREKAKTIFERAMEIADEKEIRFSFPKYIDDKQLLQKNHNWNDFELPVDKYAPPFLEEYNPVVGDCPYPWIESAIRCDGTVVSCCQKLHIMGDLNKKSFVEIWNNKKYKKLRKKKTYYDCGKYCLLTRNSVWKGDTIR
ncbi:radical SAM/SPASM domain-containing protein [Thermodesulfobacteriota bacterium]